MRRAAGLQCRINLCLNEVRPRRPEQFANDRAGQGGMLCLNEVRPRRPEQFILNSLSDVHQNVSMKSGLEGRNNCRDCGGFDGDSKVSMKSGLEGRNNESELDAQRIRWWSQ